MKRASWSAACLLLALCVALSAQATTAVPDGVKVPSWKELTSQQQADLSAFAGRWDRLPASRRVLILERQARWNRLPARKRETVREGERNFQQMPANLREKMRLSMRAVRSLPADRQRLLRQQWQAMTPQQRRDWLEHGGPGLAPPP